RGKARAETIELIVEPLTQHLQLGNELATMADDTKQRLQPRLIWNTAESLPNKPDQRRAITVIGLEPPSTKLRPRRLSLRRRQQAHAPRIATLELRRPGPMQRAGRLDRDQGLAADSAPTDEPLELVDAFPQRRQRDRLPDQMSHPTREPDPVRDLPRVDRD